MRLSTLQLLSGVCLAVCLSMFSYSPVLGAEEPENNRNRFESKDFLLGPASRFVFFSILEGLYEDGVATEDVQRILLKKEGESYYYFHFIYGCPVCSAVIWALEAYQARPARFFGLKGEKSTFGGGLPEKVREALYDQDPKQRLLALNGLIKTWIERRLHRSHFSESERESLRQALEEMRERGV